MSKNKTDSSIANKSILLSVSSLLTKMISLISTMIIVRMLSPAAYATYKQTFLAFEVVLPFLAFGLGNGLYYYLPFEKNRIRGRMNDCYTVYFIAGVLFSLFVLLGGNVLLSERFHNPDVAPLMLYTIPYMLITLLTQCNMVIFNIFNRVKTLLVFNVVRGLGTNLALIAVMLILPSAKSVVVTYSIVNSLFGIAMIVITSRILPKDGAAPQLKSMYEMMKFSIPMGIATMIGTLSVQIDSLFISSMRTPEEFAVYTVGAHELILINVITSSICAAVTPTFRLCIAESRIGDFISLFLLSMRRMASILAPMMCFFWIWSDEFISFVYSEKYIDAVWIFRVYLLYFLLRITNVTGQVFTALGMGKYILFRSALTCVLNIILNFIFIKLFGSIGAAVATVLSGWLVFAFSISPMLKKKLKMRLRETYPTRTVVCSVGLGMAVGYVIELTAGRYLVPLLLKVIDFEKILRYFGMYGAEGAETVSTLQSAFDLGVCGVLFIAIYLPLAIALMKGDYAWVVDKTREIFGKIFKKKKPAEVTEG